MSRPLAASGTGLVLLLALASCGGGDGGGEDAATPDAGLPPSRRTPACDSPAAGPFCDATEAAGLGLVQLTYPDDPIIGGVALLDHDGDGDLDLYVAGFSTSGALYRNLGGLRFDDDTAAAGLAGLQQITGAGAADIDNDGDQDLLLLQHGVGPRLWANDGAGRFTDVSAVAGLTAPGPEGTDPAPVTAVFADVDRDGLLDLYVGHWLARPGLDKHPNQLFLGAAGGTFTEVGAAAGVALTEADQTLAASFSDVDDDGDDDLWVVNDFGPWTGAPSRLLINGTAAAGAPLFTEEASARGFDAVIFGMSAAPADFDDDGDLDFYAANLGRNVLALNTAGAFADVAGQRGADVYGYDNPDIAVAPFGEPPSLYLETSAAFAERYLDPSAGQHVFTSWGTEWIDYDNDGDLDLFVANGPVGFSCWSEGIHQPDRLLRNDGGTFADVTAEVGIINEQVGGGVAAGDLDGDGDVDLVVGSQGREWVPEAPVLLRNDAPAGAALVVRLRGLASNRDGIGARVTAQIGGRTLHRVISGGHGLLSASPHQAWIGLGAAGQVDQLTIRWPSGTVDVLTDVPAGQVQVVEGSSP